MTTNSFWGHFKILKRPAGSIRKKLHLLNSYVTSKWRWMSACVRPIQAVQKTLKTLHTTFLGCLCRYPSDPFMPLGFNKIVRRRAARMTAQCMEHNRWESIQAQAFFRFWGHAARLPADRRSPLSLVLAVRNEDWLARNGHKHKRCLGFWPNAARFLQKALEANRMIGQPPYWYQAALDRPTCDLHGRMLLQVGEKFRLLAMRHPPVEEPYPSAYKYVAPTDCNDDVQAVVFCSDGSSKLAHGSYGVVILASYAELGSAIVAQGRVDGYCTNIRAEIVAACQAFTLIKQFKYYCPLISVIFLT